MTPLYNQRDTLESYSDADLLTYFLTSKASRSAHERARSLLRSAGSLSALINRNVVCEPPRDYFTVQQQHRIRAGIEIGRRIAFEAICENDVLSDPDLVHQFMALQLNALEYEVFSIVCLDNRHRVIEYREMFKGTIDSAAVYPREIVKYCLSCNAAALILVHSHPSGVPEPSDTDIRLTRKLVDALALIDIRVLDHSIYATQGYTSMAERGLL